MYEFYFKYLSGKYISFNILPFELKSVKSLVAPQSDSAGFSAF